MTQKDLVLMHLRNYGSMTSMDAIMEYGITRLADVVLKLKRDGHNIQKVDETSTNRYGKAVRYARYRLVE